MFKLSLKELIVAVVLAVAIFYLSFFAYSAYLTVYKAEFNNPIAYKEYKVALTIIEVKTVADVARMYEFMFGSKHSGNLYGFSKFTKVKGIISCVIVVPFPFERLDEHLSLLMVQGHELEHCKRGQWHSIDNTPKITTF